MRRGNDEVFNEDLLPDSEVAELQLSVFTRHWEAGSWFLLTQTPLPIPK